MSQVSHLFSLPSPLAVSVCSPVLFSKLVILLFSDGKITLMMEQTVMDVITPTVTSVTLTLQNNFNQN